MKMKRVQDQASPTSTRSLGLDGMMLPEIKSPLGVRSKLESSLKKNNLKDF